MFERVHIEDLRYDVHAYLEDPPEKEASPTNFANGGVQDTPRLWDKNARTWYKSRTDGTSRCPSNDRGEGGIIFRNFQGSNIHGGISKLPSIPKHHMFALLILFGKCRLLESRHNYGGPRTQGNVLRLGIHCSSPRWLKFFLWINLRRKKEVQYVLIRNPDQSCSRKHRWWYCGHQCLLRYSSQSWSIICITIKDLTQKTA